MLVGTNMDLALGSLLSALKGVVITGKDYCVKSLTAGLLHFHCMHITMHTAVHGA